MFIAPAMSGLMYVTVAVLWSSCSLQKYLERWLAALNDVVLSVLGLGHTESGLPRRAAICARGGKAFELYYVRLHHPRQTEGGLTRRTSLDRGGQRAAGSGHLYSGDRFARWAVRNGGRIHWKINPLNAELNPICYLLALLAHHFLHVSRIRVKSLTLKLLSYIYIYIYIWSAYSWCF